MKQEFIDQMLQGNMPNVAQLKKDIILNTVSPVAALVDVLDIIQKLCDRIKELKHEQ